MSVDKILGRSAEDDLSCNTDGGVLFEADGRLLLVSIVEYDGDAGFGDSGLSALVD